ncbi:hypothetical protein AWC38_SpisGene23952 [Stylophora pistillata]|uniref:DDE Tnp4 domain-containing protein n=1 Tax=Stylophora pistillata TaxID=50429 RepID=A0A2B4R6X0_STYPI|nr:hypothetical protein AWC38_SpisGene23952 [Stylophora pistillata]
MSDFGDDYILNSSLHGRYKPRDHLVVCFETSVVLELVVSSGLHFVTGKAAASWDKYHIDWMPTLNLRKEQAKQPTVKEEKEESMMQECSETRLLEMLEQHAFDRIGQPMCLYGDPAYSLRVHSQAPFRMVQPNPDMEAFNKSMSGVRVPVEWLFGDILTSFKFIDFKKDLKIALSFWLIEEQSYLHVWKFQIKLL